MFCLNKIALLLAVWLVACNYRIDKTVGRPKGLTGSGQDGALSATFANVREYILKPRCFTCHTGAGSGTLFADFSTHETTLGVVKPGDWATSPLFITTFLKKMPPPPAEALSEAELEFLKKWIWSGAPNN